MRARRRTFISLLCAALVLVVAAVLPLPYYLIVPGSAVDLTAAVSVHARAGAHDRFYLTDVGLIRASPLRLLLAFAPGVSLRRADTIVPPGVSPRAFDATMQNAMSQSQMMAAVVGERAAGYRIAVAPPHVVIESIDPVSMAVGRLAVGDVVRRIGKQNIGRNDDVRAELGRVGPGKVVRVTVDRAGHSQAVDVRTILFDGRTRLGVVLATRYVAPTLAVPVHYAIGDVGGSSGGLMMALRIYDALRGSATHAVRRIAGTGTIGLDGRIGPIEGTEQKLIAAKRAGARVFLVPRENYAEIAAERDVRIVPVQTFGEAVRALGV
jgi:PDZ domain-containing protein